MSSKFKFIGLLVTAALALPAALPINARADTQVTHRAHKAKKEQLPPPLPSGTRGPVPQIPLDAIPAIAPQVTYNNGMLTIVAPNSTLGDILRGVRKHTSADIEIPPSASERVVTRLGPAPAREVMAELLNGSRFNYILLGSPENANDLVRVVLVARTNTSTENPQAAAPADPNAPVQPGIANPGAPPPDASEPDAPEENADENNEQNNAAAEAEQQQEQQNQVKTPQQMLQEMQQRQMQMQQQGQPGGFPNQPGLPMPPRQPQPQPQDQ